jgi:hypothetical protein
VLHGKEEAVPVRNLDGVPEVTAQLALGRSVSRRLLAPDVPAARDAEPDDLNSAAKPGER